MTPTYIPQSQSLEMRACRLALITVIERFNLDLAPGDDFNAICADACTRAGEPMAYPEYLRIAYGVRDVLERAYSVDRVHITVRDMGEHAVVISELANDWPMDTNGFRARTGASRDVLLEPVNSYTLGIYPQAA